MLRADLYIGGTVSKYSTENESDLRVMYSK
jgi:hypothetical protein